MGLVSKTRLVIAVAIGLYLMKQFMNGPMCESKAKIDGKVVIVTGANTGIGKETAADLARRGGKVYMACRSTERGSQAAQDLLHDNPTLNKNNLIVMKLDLGSMDSIKTFVKEFKNKEKKLDILINNAGIMWIEESKTADGFESHFGVNHLGHFLLTNLLMDLIVSSAPSRVVTVSSLAHRIGNGSINLEDPMLSKDYSRIEAYAQSKLANVIFSKELGQRLKGTGVTAYSLHPGSIATELQRHTPFIGGYPVVMATLQGLLTPFFKDIVHGAQTTICCAVDEELATETAKYYSDCAEKPAGVAAAFDDEISVKLWDLSMKLVQLENKDIHQKLRR